jgi:hypothetical protein
MAIGQYKLVKLTAETINQIDGVCIFGGYVRDMLLHDHFAQLFYKHKDVDVTKYDDENYLPQYKDRLVIPNDIDCFMPTNALDLLRTAFKEAGLAILKEDTREFKNYFWMSDEDKEKHELQLTRMSIGFKMSKVLYSILPSNIKNLNVKVDIVHTKNMTPEIDPPFGMIDFECNALILGKGMELRLSKAINFAESPLEYFEKLKEIVEDIHKKRAIGCEASPIFRTHKMSSVGWHIYDDYEENHTYQIIPKSKLENDSVCLVCLSNFKHEGAVKRFCCNALYHGMCMRRMVYNKKVAFKNQCPMCRDPFSTFEISKEQDVCMW